MCNISPEFNVAETGLYFGNYSDFTLSNIALYSGKPALYVNGADTNIIVNGLFITSNSSIDISVDIVDSTVEINGIKCVGGPSVVYVRSSGGSLYIENGKFVSGTCGGILVGPDNVNLMLQNISCTNLAYYAIRLNGPDSIASQHNINNINIYNCAVTSGFPIEVNASNNVLIDNVIIYKATNNTYCVGVTGGSYGIDVDNIILRGAFTGKVSVSGGISFSHHNSSSSTGTGSEQTIAHDLAAIPTGCKAWIKIEYPVGSGRYITKDIPFDATNVYPTVDNGVAFEWGIA
jgi:hypothetical protein